jgi:SPP1 family predicted phage head-tail adaptor
VRAGRLRHRLIIERPEPTRDGSGDEIPGWVPLATVWAAIEPIKGKELTGGNQILAEMDTLIVIRWSPQVDAITAKYRLRHAEVRNPTIYNIAGPPAHVNLGQREIHIPAKSGVNTG